MNILYYVSGHGYGHAVRAAEVIRALGREHHSWRVFVKTAAPPWLFDEISSSQLHMVPLTVDSGAIEKNSSLVIDNPATIQALTDLLENAEQIVQGEVEWARRHAIRTIVADIPYLAGTIAERVGVPCVGCSNFLWDFIYEPMLKNVAGSERILQTIRDGYSKMDVLLRLTFCHEMPIFRKVIDVPLVVTRARRSINYVRNRLGISELDTRPIVYFGMRGASRPEVLERAAKGLSELILVYLGTSGYRPLENTRAVNFDSQLNFADFIAACDTVVSKPGYGMFAACVANQVNILFPRRTGFREDECLIRDVAEFTRLREIAIHDFEEGSWSEHVRALRCQTNQGKSLPTDGAERCAEFISSVVQDS